MCIFSQNWDFTIHIIMHRCVCVCVCVCIYIYMLLFSSKSCPAILWRHGLQSSVHGISHARILDWMAISLSRGSSQPRDWTHVSYIGRWILYHTAQGKWKWKSLSPVTLFVTPWTIRPDQSCPTLCNPMNCSTPGHEIRQAREVEWVAIPFSRRSLQPRHQTQVFCIAGRFSTNWSWEDTGYWYPAFLLNHEYIVMWFSSGQFS